MKLCFSLRLTSVPGFVIKTNEMVLGQILLDRNFQESIGETSSQLLTFWPKCNDSREKIIILSRSIEHDANSIVIRTFQFQVFAH